MIWEDLSDLNDLNDFKGMYTSSPKIKSPKSEIAEMWAETIITETIDCRNEDSLYVDDRYKIIDKQIAEGHVIIFSHKFSSQRYCILVIPI